MPYPVIQQTLGPDLPLPLHYGSYPSAWAPPSFPTSLTCPALYEPIKKLLHNKFILSNPADKAQKAFQTQIESVITQAMKADTKVNFYFRTVLSYLPNFKIYIQNELSTKTTKGETALAVYSASKRLLRLELNQEPALLIQLARHEMRHAFMHYIQLTIVKNMTCSAQVFDETAPTEKRKYEDALDKDLRHIDSLMAKVKTGKITPETRGEIKKLEDTFKNGGYAKAYNLLNNIHLKKELAVGYEFNMSIDKSGNFIPAIVVVQRSIYDKKLNLFQISYKFKENNIFFGALQQVRDINRLHIQSYESDVKLFERDAFLHGSLPSFMIEFFYPHTTKLVAKFTDHRSYKPPLTAWPICSPTTDISNCELTAKFGIKAYLDTMRLDSTIINKLEARINEPETVFALQYILSKLHNNPTLTTLKPRLSALLAKALQIKYKNAGILGYLTGANNVLLHETCKAYFHAYKIGTLDSSDYIECLPLLHNAKDPHYKVMRQKALNEAQWMLQNTHPDNYTRIVDLQQQILILNAMPKY